MHRCRSKLHFSTDFENLASIFEARDRLSSIYVETLQEKLQLSNREKVGPAVDPRGHTGQKFVGHDSNSSPRKPCQEGQSFEREAHIRVIAIKNRVRIPISKTRIKSYPLRGSFRS